MHEVYEIMARLRDYDNHQKHKKAQRLCNTVVAGPTLVTPEGVELFKAMLKDKDALREFYLQSLQSQDFLSALFRTSAEGRSLVVESLCQEGVVPALISAGQRANLNGMFKKLSPEEVKQILAVPGTKESVSSCNWHGPAPA